MPSSDHTAAYQNTPLGNIPMIGNSIGGIDSDEIGTLGLYIECTSNDGLKEIYALVRMLRCQTFHATSVVSLASLVAFDMWKTILDVEVGNVAHRITIEAPARADAEPDWKEAFLIQVQVLSLSKHPVH